MRYDHVYYADKGLHLVIEQEYATDGWIVRTALEYAEDAQLMVEALRAREAKRAED